MHARYTLHQSRSGRMDIPRNMSGRSWRAAAPALTTSREAVRDAGSRQRSPNTVDAYRRDTDQWFEWLDSHGYDWRAATRLLRSTATGTGRATTGAAADLRSHRRPQAHVAVIVLRLRRARPRAARAQPRRRVKRSARDDRPLTVATSLDRGAPLHRRGEGGGPDAARAHPDDALHRHPGLWGVHGHRRRPRHGPRPPRAHCVTQGRPPAAATAGPGRLDALQVNLDGRRSGALFLAQRVPLYRQEAYRIVRRVAAAADIPEKHITPHGLRRTAATILLDAGESTRAVQHMLATATRNDHALRRRPARHR